VSNDVFPEFESWDLLPEHEIQFIGSPTASFGNVVPCCCGGEETHSAEQPSDLALQVRFVGVDHVRVDDIDDETEELVAHVTPSDDSRSETSRSNFSGVGISQWSKSELESKHVEHCKDRHGPDRARAVLDKRTDADEETIQGTSVNTGEEDVPSSGRVGEQDTRKVGNKRQRQCADTESERSLSREPGQFEEVGGVTEHELNASNLLAEVEQTDDPCPSSVGTLEDVDPSTARMELGFKLEGLLNDSQMHVEIIRSVPVQSLERMLSLINLALLDQDPG